MKRTYILSTSLFALLLSAYPAQASDIEALDDAVVVTTPVAADVSVDAVEAVEELATPDATPVVVSLPEDAAPEFDPRDLNKDGKVSLKEKIVYALDRNKDGHVNFDDFWHLLGFDEDAESDVAQGFGKLLQSMLGILDQNGDEVFNLDDAKIMSNSINEMGAQFSSIFVRLENAFAVSVDPETGEETPNMLAQLPAALKNPLEQMITIAKTIADTIVKGSTASNGVIEQLQGAASKVSHNINQVGKANFDTAQLVSFKTEMATVGGLVSKMLPGTGVDKTVNKIDKKLAKIKG